MTSPGQPYVIHLHPSAARRALELLDRPDSVYHDLSELLGVALENQLALEDGALAETSPEGEASTALDPLLAAPAASAGLPTAPPARNGNALFVLTNRLSPIALAIRVLVNLQRGEHGPDLDEFLDAAGRCARMVGQRLKEEDKRTSRNGVGNRKSIGWPVGEDEKKSLDRFTWAFLVHEPSDADPGAMAELGLASVINGTCRPTEDGADLAVAPNPLLDQGAEGWTLSREQQAILRRCALNAPGELAEIATVVRPVREDAQAQEVVDARIRDAHPDWTENRVVAQRAAMLGRLRDLGVLETEGRGRDAQVRLLPEAEEFASAVLDLSEEGETSTS